ncbi:MAG: methyltransferase domain-containing protein, partial [Balneolaceae bacterium]
MITSFLQRLKSLFQKDPDQEFIAAQLRKPSGSYAREIASSMDKVNESQFDLTLEKMKLKNNESILEIGFGSGSFMEKLFQETYGLHVTGIDYSPQMVSLATSINKSRVESGQLKLHEGSSDNLPFDDQSFDKAYCNMVIFFWDEPEKHLKEV